MSFADKTIVITGARTSVFLVSAEGLKACNGAYYDEFPKLKPVAGCGAADESRQPPTVAT